MSRASRRNAMERLLRSAATPGAPDARQAACPDAEALAAFVEGGLSPAEARAVTTHAADCEGCQAVLAALARSAEEPAPGRLGGLLGRPVRWLVPVASLAAASLALYIAVHPRPSLEAPARTDPPPTRADRRLPAAQVPGGEPERDVGSPAPQVVASPQKQERERRRDEQGRRKAAQAVGPDVRPPLSAAPAPASPPSVVPPSAPETLSEEKRVADSAASGHVAQREDQPGRPEEKEGLGKTQPAGQVAERVADRASKVAVAAGASAPVLEIRSPEGTSVWRFGPGPVVVRSVDGGATWQPATRLPGSAAAAAAPSASVCWVVGRDGLVLLTRDGARWERRTPPSSADLVAVGAVDADRATVRTANGQEFATVDGARTWTPSDRR